MSLTFLYSSNALLRATLKTLVFGVSSFAAIFCASAGYGLLKMLLPAFSGGATIGIAEFSTHSGLTILFFVLAGIGAYGAKKCFW
jgi:asparagine N-glycosylation enzyme membrane subunit Stt3